VATSCDVVDPQAECRSAAHRTAERTAIATFSTIDELPRKARYDAAIVASTAAGRLELCTAVGQLGIPAILIEKPLEQSRARTRALLEWVAASRSVVWVNHYRRTLPGYDTLRRGGEPLVISVSSGAIGLGVNGIHWIDFALDVTGARSGQLLFGEIEETGVFGFSDGSRMLLSCSARSSAPAMLSVVTPTSHWIVDQQGDKAWRHSRAATVTHPTYLYGKDYDSETVEGLEAIDLSTLTESWIQAVRASREPPQPRVAAVAPAYELLFDLLETSGEKRFHFT
jgi:predicted dehydrogenase